MNPTLTAGLTPNAIATVPAGPTAAQAALALIRDEANGPADLASYFQQSETWAAGLIHAVCGDDDFAFAASMDDYHPTREEMQDYQAGFAAALAMAALAMLDAENGAVIETVPAWTQYPTDPTPVPSWDVPF